MEKHSTDWTQEEFHAYLLLYAAQAEYIETPEEKEIILSKVDEKTYGKIHREIKKDNDFQSIEKILYTIEKYNYSKDDIESFLKEIKDLFLSAEEFHILEKNMLIAMKRILQPR